VGTELLVLLVIVIVIVIIKLLCTGLFVVVMLVDLRGVLIGGKAECLSEEGVESL
jgi:hypothetical protein